MRSTITTETVEITCTLEDLAKMVGLHMGIYATPTPDGRANQVYMSQRAHFKYDYLLATVEDFEAVLGYEITEEVDEIDRDDEVTITVPRERQDREA